MPIADTALLRQLSENSAPYRDPLAGINWLQLGAPGFWLPEPALSLHGLPEYDALALPIRQKLSQYEFANVLHCGLWLEGMFLQRMSRRLQPGMPRAEHEYLLHELREEAGHSLMFLRAIEAGGLAISEGSWRAPRAAHALARAAPAGGALFWLAMLIGEDLPDKFNRYLRSQPDGVNPAVRQICTLHVIDEARHISLAGHKLESALAGMGRLRRELFAGVARVLLWQLARAFYFPPARFYELAGLTRGEDWRAAALGNSQRRRFVAERIAPTARVLESYGLQIRR
ncbi:MAG TPA: diiron oxygenase [Burkholderiales bacterium]